MSLWTHNAIVLAAAWAMFLSPARLRADVSPEAVRDAIDHAVDFLKRRQHTDGKRQHHKDGMWIDNPSYPDGITALCTLALLNAGVDPQDESIQRPLAYLRTRAAGEASSRVAPAQTYVVSLEVMVLCAAEPKKDLLLIRRLAKWLEETQHTSGEGKGGWSYPSPAGNSGDESNSQFALLALYEAERIGIKVNERTWRLAVQYWQRRQNPDGSWGYMGRAGSGSMTCAGISSMVIASGQVSSGDATVTGDQVICCGRQTANEAIEHGLRWLQKNFSVHSNPGAGGSREALSNSFYYLYGLERVGRMTARRFIGNHDWYREGADQLVRRQLSFSSGSWKGPGVGESYEEIATSFALLFLAKGRRPVLIAKLKHGPDQDWNHHRSDLANLTSYVEKKWGRDLTWQVIDPAVATVEDLLQSPVLFFNGEQAPEFSDQEKQHLRDYIDRGGFLFAEACCGGTKFEAGFRKLMDEIFPEQEYKLRLLPPEHPIWRAEEPIDPQYARPLWGIDVGCRTSVVFCPDNLSCYWELARPGRKQQLPAKVEAEVLAAEAIGCNVLAYATNRELKYKFEHFVTADGNSPRDDFDRGKLYSARLLHPGGCSAAPGALPNLLRLAGEKLKLRVSSEARELPITDPKLFHYHLVFMHGRHGFRLTPQERKQLRTYLERGGMLFADAICSSREFSEAFAREMAALFPEQRLQRIGPRDPLFTPQFGGDDLSLVARREPQRGAADGPLRSQVREGEPYLEGLKLGERWAVIFSPYDVSCALENHESLECEGYTHKDAARIALNVLLYSFHQ